MRPRAGGCVPPGDGPHLLGDLGLGPDGTVFVSDARAGTVYRLRPGAGALEALVPDHTFASPQTPVLTADGGTLLVPDWTLGLFALPLSGGEPRPLRGPGDLVTAGIDGLAPAPGGLVAVQNGIVQPRVIRLWLSPDGRAITRWAVLGRGPDLGDPTHVVATRQGRAGAHRQRLGTVHRRRRAAPGRTPGPAAAGPAGPSLSIQAK